MTRNSIGIIKTERSHQQVLPHKEIIQHYITYNRQTPNLTTLKMES